MAGGQSKRFGSDKGLYKHKGKLLISHVIETLSEFHYPIFIAVNSNQQAQKYIENIDIKAITGIMIDDYSIVENKRFRSPLIGLYTSFKELNALNFHYAFILSCDNPFMQKPFIKYMIDQCSKFDACVPTWKNQFIEPLLSIYKVEPFLNKSANNLRKSDFKLSNLLDTKLNINYISIEGIIKKLDTHLLSFININDAKDLENINRKKIKKF